MRPRRRTTDRRATLQAERIALELVNAQAEHALTWRQVAHRAGVSVDTVRRVMHGDPGVQLNTLCAVGTALALDVVVRAYRSERPSLRDSGQLELARWLCSIAHPSWNPELEVRAGEHGEAIDLAFFGVREIVDVEIDRLILDFQDQYRRNVRKRDFLATQHHRPVRLVMAILDTPRNRAAVAPHATLMEQVFGVGSRAVLGALRAGRPIGADGLVWVRRPARAAAEPRDRSVS